MGKKFFLELLCMSPNRRYFILKLLIAICVVYWFVYFMKNVVPVVRKVHEPSRNCNVVGNRIDEKLVVVEENVKAVKRVIDFVEHKQIPDKLISVKTSSNPTHTVLAKVRAITKCVDKRLEPKIQQRGDHWILYNYIIAQISYRCHESITYTTHADYSFMDNVVPLLERWNGPISLALHAPGTDFQNTLDSIAYLRECTTPMVKELVTFHIYFSVKHIPEKVPKQDDIFLELYNCSVVPPFLNVSSENMYRTRNKLLYPVNVGRNVARETAQTHFILPSDIELYPSPSLIDKFLAMIAESDGHLRTNNLKIYPLPIFEVSTNQSVPENKTRLREMLAEGTAITFHKYICAACHNIPKAKQWEAAEDNQDLHVFHVGKRNGRFVHWEPIFIGTHHDPLYDERLTWEGRMDKMTQSVFAKFYLPEFVPKKPVVYEIVEGSHFIPEKECSWKHPVALFKNLAVNEYTGYALCALDYDFMILDNAFLVHKPGIKIYQKDSRRDTLAEKVRQLIYEVILPELKVLYGVRKGCDA